MLVTQNAHAGTAPAISGRGGPDSMLHTRLSNDMCVCLAWLSPSKAQTTQLPRSAGNCLMLWQCTAWAGPPSAPLLKVKAKAKSKGLVEHQSLSMTSNKQRCDNSAAHRRVLLKEELSRNRIRLSPPAAQYGTPPAPLWPCIKAKRFGVQL